MTTFAVVLTHNRHAVASALVSSLVDSQVDVVVVDHASDPPFEHPRAVVVRNEDPLPNISALWNLGLEAVEVNARARKLSSWDVAVLNDDLIVPPQTIQLLAMVMRAYGVDAAFPDVHGAAQITTQPTIRRSAGFEPINLFHRMAGFCFVLRGEMGMRADEQFEFWYGDDDLDWRLRAGNGTVQVPLGTPITHLSPNESANRPELAAIAGADRERFFGKYGRYPW